LENKSILVSVVVPIYNIGLYIEDCIVSLINQTYNKLEIILVNDGSTDNCGKICDHFASLDSRIKVIHKENGGLIDARKSGLKIASGEYVGYVDGDDWVEADYFEEFVNEALNSNADIVIAGHKENLVGHIEILENQISYGVYKGEILIKEIYPKMLFSGNFSQFGIFSYVWGKLFRKSVLYENQMKVDNDIFIGEDAACLYPTILDSNIISILNTAKYHYRQRVDSLIKTAHNKEILKINVFYQYLKKQFLKSKYYNILLPQLQYFTLSLLTVRSQGPEYIFPLENILYPFNNVKYGDKIVIYGAGTFGQHLNNRLLANDNYKLTGWIDELSEYYNILGIKVNGLSALNCMDYDSIIVAFIDETIANLVEQKLINFGIPKFKIHTVTHFKNKNINDLLNDFGVI
jgi:glycosyltransferase involved in cell wall biosynthesis